MIRIRSYRVSEGLHKDFDYEDFRGLQDCVGAVGFDRREKVGSFSAFGLRGLGLGGF